MCTIEIVSKIDAEADAVARALQKANQYIPTADEIRIICDVVLLPTPLNTSIRAGWSTTSQSGLRTAASSCLP